MVLLGENAIKSMAPGRFFRDHKGAVNSLDFHHTEDVMVTVGAWQIPSFLFLIGRGSDPVMKTSGL
jgi:hypothetical protein|tara:strand:- start:4208 stop:4405 length:198 start_codon:yes stop_codon:yes gene_type:complete